jgi:predicted ATPase with chaperone activity
MVGRGHFYKQRREPTLLPGDVLRAPGIFFLDELPEFRNHVIVVLRQPIEKM